MSNRNYKITGAVSDADFEIKNMSQRFERGYASITFYSDSNFTQIVTPTAGTVTFTVSENGDIYGTVTNGTVSALNVGPAVTYARPNWSGISRAAKVNLSSVVGASFFVCNINRYGVG